MKIAVLFDGAGLARLGLEQAGHECVEYELNPIAHYLSLSVGSGNCELADVKDVDLIGFHAAWASPPCQGISSARTGEVSSEFSKDDSLLTWSLELKERWPNLDYFWVENVTVQEGSQYNGWGKLYNAAQFLQDPIQNRNRIIGGHYPLPYTLRPYKRAFKGICPCITATEGKGCGSKRDRRASRFYGRRLTVEECAFHQGFQVPKSWYKALPGFTPSKWKDELYKAIGNGVPTYMAKAFGEAAMGYSN